MKRNWFRKSLDVSTRGLGKVRQKSISFLRCEELETRDVPATITGTTALTFAAGGGVSNNITVAISGANFAFTDTAETITTTIAGASGSGTNTVLIPTTSVTGITLNLGDGTDTIATGGVVLATQALSINHTGAGLTLTGPLTSTTGAITVNNTGTGAVVQNGVVSSTSGNISISSNNALTANANINAGSGTIALLANQDAGGAEGFTQTGGTITTTNTTTSAVSVTVNKAAGGTGDASIDSTSVGVAATGGRLNVNSNGGNVLFGGTTALTAAQVGFGTTNQNTGAAPARVLASRDYAFTSSGAGSIGTASRPLQATNIGTDASGGSNFSFAAGSGGVYLTKWGTIDMTITGASTTGAGSIQLVTASATGDNMFITGNISAVSGNIYLTADDNLDVSNSIIGGANFSGTVWMEGNTDRATNGQPTTFATTASILTSNTTNQSLLFTSRTPLTQAVYMDIGGGTNAGGGIVQVNNITTGDGGRVVLSGMNPIPATGSTAGFIRMASTSSIINVGPTGTVEFNTALLNASATTASDSIGSAATPVKVAGGNVVVNNNFGNVYITGTAATNFTLTNTATVAGQTGTALNNLSTTAGALTINGATSSVNNGTLTLNGAGGVVLNADLGSATTGAIGITGGLSGSNNITSSGNVTINQATDSSYAGTISTPGGLVKQGAGNLTFSTAQTFPGASSVAGTLTTAATNSFGSTLNVTGTLNPGGVGTPAAISTAGAISFASGSALNVTLNGTTPGSGYDQITVGGAITLAAGTALNPTLGYTPAIGDSFTILSNSSTGSLTGTFTGLGEGASFLLGAQWFKITYKDGTNANSVKITAIAAPSIRYVDDAWATGFNNGDSISNPDPIASGEPNATFGTTAFSSLQAAINAANPNDTIIVNAGSYPETVSVNKVLNLIFQENAVSVNSIAVATGFEGSTITLNGVNLTIGDTTTSTIGAVITGTGGLVKAGSGTLTLTNPSNSYTGGTTVNAGKLLLGTTGALPSKAFLAQDTAVTVATGATLALNGFSYSFGSLAGDGTIENASATNTTLTVGSLGANTTFSGLIQNGTGTGILNVVKTGTGTFTLSGLANTYTGTTTANGGVLEVATLANGGTASSIGQSTSVAGNVVLSGGAILRYTPAATIATTDRNITVGTGGATVEVTDAASAVTIAGVSGGTNAFAKAGAGRLTISAANGLVSGNIAVNAGTLAISSITLSSTRVITIATGAFVDSTGTITTTANATAAYSAIAGAGTLNLVSTTNSAAVPDLYFNSNNVDNATTNFGTRIATAINLGSTQRFIWAKTNHNGVAQYGTGADAALAGPVSAAPGVGITYIAQNTYTGTGPMETPLYLAAADTFTGAVQITRGSVYAGTTTSLNGNDLLLNPSAGNNARFFLFGQNTSIGNLGSSGGGTALIVNSPDQGVVAPATLTINQTVDGTFAGNIIQTQREYVTASTGSSGAISLVKNGSASLTLSGTNSIAGTVAVNTGTLNVNGSLATTGGVTVATGATLGGTGTVAGAVVVNGTLSPSGPAATGILGTSNVSFGTGGTLAVQLNGVSVGSKYDQLNVTGTVDLTNATLSLTNVDANQVTPGTQLVIINNDAAEAVIGTFAGLAEGANVSAFGVDFTISYVGGDGNDVVLNRLSPGTVTVDSTFNSSTPGFGTTTFATISDAINAGTTAPFSSVVIDAGTYNEAVVINKAIVLSLNGNVTLGSLADIAVPVASTVNTNGFQLTLGTDNSTGTYSGSIVGTGSVAKSGTGTLTLSGTNGYTGGTTVNAGTLTLGSVNALGNPSSSVTVASGATLQLAGQSISLGNLTGAGTVDNNAATAVSLTLSPTANSTLAAAITNSGTGALSLIKNGTFALTLSGNNTYTGTTAINGGSVVAGSNLALGTASAVTLATGAALSLNGFNLSVGSIAGTGSISNGAATNSILTFGADNTSTLFNGSISNGSTGTLALLKTGTGTFDSNGAKTYTGGTTISQGTLRSNNATGLGTGTVTLGDANTAANNVAFLSSVNGVTFANNFVVSASGTGTATIGTADGITGAVNTQWNGTLTLNRTTILRAGSVDRTTFAGAIGGAGGIVITAQAAANRVSFAQAAAAVNTFAGDIDVQSGLFQVGVNSTTTNQFIPDTSSLNVASGASVRFSGTGSESINALTGAGSVSQGDNVGAYTLTIGAGNGSGTFSGVLSMSPTPSAAFTIVKDGTGTQTFSGANTYTGTTTVNRGNLVLAASTGSATGTSTVTVGASGALATTGNTAITGAATNNGLLTPGGIGATGIFSSGNLAAGTTSFFGVDLNSTTAGTGYDQANVTGTVTLAGQLRVFAGTGLALNSSYTIINNDSTDAVTGAFANVANGAVIRASNDPRYSFTLNTAGGDGNDVVLTLTSIDAFATGLLDVSGGQVVYTTAGGIASNVGIALNSGTNTFNVTDGGAAITLSSAAVTAGWTVASGVASGPSTGITNFALNLGDGADQLATITTGTANLTVTGSGTLNVNGAVTTSGTFAISEFAQVGGTGSLSATGTTINGGMTPLTLGNLAAAAGSLSINSTSAINALNGTTSVSSDTLNLNANAIGNFALPLKSAVSNLNITAGNLGAYVTETDGANLAATATGAGNLTIGNLSGTLNVGGAVTTATGNISLSSNDGIALAANVNAGTGTITLAANADGTGNQGISQTAGTLTTTNTGTTAVAITVNTLSGGTGDASIDSITDSGRLTVNSNGGSILYAGTNTLTTSQRGIANGGAAPARTLGALNYVLTATGAGSVGTDARPLQTSALASNTFTLKGGDGGVYVTDWVNPTFLSGATATGPGNIRVAAANAGGHNLNVTGPVTAGSGNIYLAADDDFFLTAAIGGTGFSGTVYLADNRDLGNGNNLQMNAGASITTSNTTANAVMLEGNSISGTATGNIIVNNITVGNGGTITVTNSSTTSGAAAGASNGQITAFNSGVVLNAGTNGTVVLTASPYPGVTSAIGTSANPIVVTSGNVVVNSFNSTAGTGSKIANGDVYVTGTGTTNFIANVSAPGGAGYSGVLNLTTNSGLLTISGPSGTSTTGGNINLTSTGTGGGIVIAAPISTTGNYILNAGTNPATITSSFALGATQTLTATANGGTSIANGGTFNAAGSTNSPVTLQTGGLVTIAGTGVGTFALGTFTGSAGSQLRLDVNSTGTAGTNFDSLAITGDLNLGGATPVVFLGNGYVPTVGDSFAVATFTGNLTGYFGTDTAATQVAFRPANNSAVLLKADYSTPNVVLLKIDSVTNGTFVDVSGTQIVYSGGTDANANNLTISYDAGTGKYTFKDTGTTSGSTPIAIGLGAGAISAGFVINPDGSATGTVAGLTGLNVDLGVGVDTLTLLSLNNPLTATGGGDAGDTAIVKGILNTNGNLSLTSFTDIVADATTPGQINAGNGTVTLSASNGVGTATQPVLTKAGTIVASAGAGNISIREADGAGFTGTTTGSGNISFVNDSGTLTISGATSTNTGNISLSSVDGITVATDLGSVGTTNSGGTVTIAANTDGLGNQGFLQTGGLIGTTNLSATAVSITVNNATGGTGDASLDNVQTAGNLAVSSNTGNILYAGSTPLSDSQRGILSGGSGPARVLRATSYNFTSSNAAGIGTDDRPIQIDNFGPDGLAPNPVLTASAGTGGVYVTGWDQNSTNDLTTGTISAQGAGNIRIVAGNQGGHNLYVKGNVSTGSGNIFLAADDNLEVQPNVVIGGAGFSGTVWLSANRDIATNGQPVTFDKTASIVTTSKVNQNVALSARTPATQAVYLEIGGGSTGPGIVQVANITTGDGGRVVLNGSNLASPAQTGLIRMADVSNVINVGPTGTLDLQVTGAPTLADNIGSALLPIRVAGGNVVVNDSNGNVFVTADGATNFTAKTTTAGALNLATTAGLLTINQNTSSDGSSAINLNGAGGVALNATLGSATSGAIGITGALSGMGTIATGTGQLTLTQTTDSMFGGVIGGTQGLNKQGAGVLTLAGANTYSGATNINEGGLIVNGSLAAGSAVTVANNATLGGTGTVGVVVASGNLTGAGTGTTGTLNTGNVSFGTTGTRTFTADISGSSAGLFDKLNVTGTVNLTGSTLAIIPALSGLVALDSYRIIDNDGTDAVTGIFTGLAEGSLITVGSNTFQISYAAGTNNNDVVLTKTGTATTTALTGQAGPAFAGNNLSFTATIAPANASPAPTGTVTFFVDGIAQTPVPVVTNAGVTTATFSTNTLTVGTHTIVAIYNGDGNYGTSTSTPPFSQVINPSATGPTVSGVLVNGSVAPNASVTASRVTSLQVNFSTNVNIAAGAFTLTNGTQTITSAAGGNIAVAGSGTGSITLTFTNTANGVEFGSLMDGIWTLSIDKTKVTTSSGGTAIAADFSQANVRRLFGDVNGDGTVEIGDFSAFSSTFNLSTGDPGFLSAFDFNGDGTVEIGDFSAFSARFNTSL